VRHIGPGRFRRIPGRSYSSCLQSSKSDAICNRQGSWSYSFPGFLYSACRLCDLCHYRTLPSLFFLLRCVRNFRTGIFRWIGSVADPHANSQCHRNGFVLVMAPSDRSLYAPNLYQSL